MKTNSTPLTRRHRGLADGLARRLEEAWAAFEEARTHGVLAGLRPLRRWALLRQALEAELLGGAFVHEVQAAEVVIALPCEGGEIKPAAEDEATAQVEVGGTLPILLPAAAASLMHGTLWTLAPVPTCAGWIATGDPEGGRQDGFDVSRGSAGEIMVKVMLPPPVASFLAASPWKRSLPERVGNVFAILAAAAGSGDGELEPIGREGLASLAAELAAMAPDVEAGRGAPMRMDLTKRQWAAYELAAELSGRSVAELLAGCLCREWAREAKAAGK